MVFKAVQPSKVFSSIFLMPAPSVTVSRAVQSANVLSNFLTGPSIEIDCKEVQFLKAPSLISVTESGMTMLVSPVQPSKAYWRIYVTELGIVMTPKLVQFSKAPYPISVTELGMVTLVKPVQPPKVSKPI